MALLNEPRAGAKPAPIFITGREDLAVQAVIVRVPGDEVALRGSHCAIWIAGRALTGVHSRPRGFGRRSKAVIIGVPGDRISLRIRILAGGILRRCGVALAGQCRQNQNRQAQCYACREQFLHRELSFFPPQRAGDDHAAAAHSLAAFQRQVDGTFERSQPIVPPGIEGSCASE